MVVVVRIGWTSEPGESTRAGHYSSGRPGRSLPLEPSTKPVRCASFRSEECTTERARNVADTLARDLVPGDRRRIRGFSDAERSGPRRIRNPWSASSSSCQVRGHPVCPGAPPHVRRLVQSCPSRLQHVLLAPNAVHHGDAQRLHDGHRARCRVPRHMRSSCASTLPPEPPTAPKSAGRSTPRSSLRRFRHQASHGLARARRSPLPARQHHPRTKGCNTCQRSIATRSTTTRPPRLRPAGINSRPRISCAPTSCVPTACHSAASLDGIGGDKHRHSSCLVLDR
jgi:hypothetical protein